MYYIEKEAEGEQLTLENTANEKIKKFEVFGNHKQETREGYNILDYLSNIRSSINGLTIDKDEETGYITVNGTPTANYTVLSMGGSAFSLTNILEDGQTYTLWQENHAENDAKGIYLQVRIAKISDGSAEQYINSSKVNKTFTVDKSLYTYTASIQTGTKTQAGTFSNYKNRYMIYKGTDEKEFELYGASPSPDYPSKVVCLGSNTDGTFKGSTEIIKTNKNMLCKPKNSIVTGRGLTVNYNEGKFIINGTTTTGTYIKLDKELKVDAFQNTGSWSKNSVLNPGSYMFSIKTISGTSSSTNVNLYIRNTTGR